MFFVHPLTSMSQGAMDWNFVKMIKHAAHVTIGSDWSLQDPAILPACALILDNVAEAFIDDFSTDKRVKAAETICRWLTVAGAVATQRETMVGTIAPGKKANFIMVDRDLAKGEFEGAQVLNTWFEGEKVFETA